MKTFNLKRTCFILWISLITLFETGCVSMSTFQTARTTPKDDFGFGFGAGTVNSDLDLGTDTVHISFPFIEAYGRYGITDKLDLGLKLTFIGTIASDIKYQFLGDQNSVFAGSVGAGVGYMSIFSGNTKSKVFDLMLPVYFSVHPAKIIGIYFNPKYIYRINNYTVDSEKGNSNSSWYGITGGFRFGKKTALFVEYSFFKNSDISKPFNQITCGIAMGIL